MGRSRTGDRRGKPGDPCALAIFGASGDLAKRKLFPALLNLKRSGLLRNEFAVLGLATSEMASEAFRERLTADLHSFAPQDVDSDLGKWLCERTYYAPGNFRAPEAYARLAEGLRTVQEKHGTRGNVLFYLATPPDFFGDIVDRLGEAGLTAETGEAWRRVIIEKPFGHDYDSARALNGRLRKVLGERQIYRIDHYLGKETVQNMMVFRFANGIFEPVWNRRYIDHVQITVAEAVRDEKAKVLRAIQPFSPEEVLLRTVRGQYGDGADPERPLPAYRAEPRVAPDSSTETYVALKLGIDN